MLFGLFDKGLRNFFLLFQVGCLASGKIIIRERFPGFIAAEYQQLNRRGAWRRVAVKSVVVDGNAQSAFIWIASQTCPIALFRIVVLTDKNFLAVDRFADVPVQAQPD